MPTVSKITFGESSFKSSNLPERHRKRPILNSISQMSDDEIIQASAKDANKKAEECSAARALNKWPLMFIAATTVAAGALTKGKLSDKTLSAAKTLGATATIYALSKPVDTITDKLLNREDKEGNKKEANPFVQLAVGVAALAGASALVIGGAKKGGDKLAKMFRPTADAMKKGLARHADKLDGSILGKAAEKISKRTSEIASRYPKLASVTRNAALFAPFAGALGGSVILANEVQKERENNFFSNVEKLATVREFARTALKDDVQDTEKSKEDIED